MDLMSITTDKIVRVLKSSGTSGSIPSKIFLDKINSKNQMIALNEIMKKIFENKKRLPMLIFDKKPNNNNLSSFNARVAAIQGFSLFGKNPLFLIDENDKIKIEDFINFLSKYKNQDFFLFGFTSMVYKHLLQNKSIKNLKLNLSKGILIHGGGWKN